MIATRRIVAAAMLLLCTLAGFAYTERNMLCSQTDIGRLKSALVMNQKWVPYPAYADRDGWARFLGSYRQEYISQGEKLLNYEWKVVRATDYMEFERSGSREVMERPFEQNNRAIASLLMAELAEGRGRFVGQIINGVFHSCEMTSWALSAHLVVQPSHRSLPAAGYDLIDLTSGDLGSLLSWTYYFLHREFDRVNPEISRRLRRELQRRIMDAYISDDTLWWAGRNYKGRMLNNWNPWCNSNVLTTFMLMENDPERLARGVYMTMESVDKFLNYIKGDGACEEGPSYWGHAAGKTLDYLELLKMATGGRVDIFGQSMIRRMGEYISRSYVGGGWVVNFADASARGGGDAALVYRFGQNTGSDELKGFAALLRGDRDEAPNRGRDIYETLQAVAVADALRRQKPVHTLRPFTWYPETEFCYQTTPQGLFFAAKGGYNDESHNHNDVGSFSLWMDQTPVFVDAGVGTYTRQTFSSERYSIWTMQSAWHNLPMPNGSQQSYGRRFKARNAKAAKGSFAVDIAGAYPDSAGVDSWVRSYRVAGRKVVVSDRFRLTKAVAPNVVNFMTWGEVDTSHKGRVLIKIKNVQAELVYDASLFDLKVDTVSLADPKLSDVWGTALCRLSFSARRQTLSGTYSFTIK